MATGSLTRHEIRTVLRRREAEGVLPIGDAGALYGELNADIAATDLVILPETAEMEREFGVVLEACFSQTPPIFIRTNDALHLASAIAGGEPEFITADARQRTAASLMGIHGVALAHFFVKLCAGPDFGRVRPSAGSSAPKLTSASTNAAIAASKLESLFR